MTTATATAPLKPMGQILIERGLITQADLTRALSEQKRSGHKKLLGETVIELGLCTEDQIVEALAAACDIPYAKLTLKLVDSRIAGALPRDLIDKQRALPLFKVDGVLTVAITEPTDVVLIEEIGRVAGGPVQFVATTGRDIAAILQSGPASATILELDEDGQPGRIDEGLADNFDLQALATAADGSEVIKLVNRLIYRRRPRGRQRHPHRARRRPAPRPLPHRRRAHRKTLAPHRDARRHGLTASKSWPASTSPNAACPRTAASTS